VIIYNVKLPTINDEIETLNQKDYNYLGLALAYMLLETRPVVGRILDRNRVDSYLLE